MSVAGERKSEEKKKKFPNLAPCASRTAPSVRTVLWSLPAAASACMRVRRTSRGCTQTETMAPATQPGLFFFFSGGKEERKEEV